MQIAPPATPFQDFTYHWKQLMNFYADHLTDTKVPIETTGIPRHLDSLLQILILEEKENDEPGPCLEYLIQYKLLDLLATLACAESPPGMRLICLTFFRKLLTRSKHPLLHHAAIFSPIQRLIAICDGNLASPIESEEVQFLLALCFLVCKYPHCTSIVNESRNIHRERTTPHGDSERTEIQSVTYVPVRKCNKSNPLFQPLNTQAVTLVNPNLFTAAYSRRRSICSDRISSKINSVRGGSQESLEHRRDLTNDSQNVPSCSNTSSRSNESSGDVESTSQSSSPHSQKLSFDNALTIGNTCDIRDSISSVNVPDEMEASSCDTAITILNRIENLKIDTIDTDYSMHNSCEANSVESPLSDLENPENSKCLLLDSLKSYINSAVSILMTTLKIKTSFLLELYIFINIF